jgi:predicted DNA-binding transcriptional regulator YafY
MKLNATGRRKAGPADVAAACLMSSLATTLRDTSLKHPMARIRDDVVASSRHARDARDLDRKFWFVSGGGEAALPREQIALSEVIDALLATRSLKFDYTHFDGKLERSLRVEPMTLALHEHQFYVIARRPSGDYYPFRFARMSQVKVEREFTYPTPGQYDPSRLFQNVFGIFVASDAPVQDVHVRLATSWLSYIESHRWHETQTHRIERGGQILVSLRVRPSVELTRWVLWFGPDAEALAPTSLRAEVAEKLRAAAAIYGDRFQRKLAKPKSPKSDVVETRARSRRRPSVA